MLDDLPRTCILSLADGSLHKDGKAGCAGAIYNGGGGRVQVTTTTGSAQSELVGIHKTVEHHVNNSYHDLIISDSKTALCSLDCLRSVFNVTLSRIQNLLSTSKDGGFNIQFLWIPSHIGFSNHDDKMARQACLEPEKDLNLSITSNVVKSVLIYDAFEDPTKP